MPETIHFSQPVRTAEEASKARSISKGQTVKSVLLVLGEKKAVLCVLTGDRKIDFKKIRALYSIKNVRTATPEEVKRHTGYGIGEVPPVARGNFEVVVDARVLEQEEVYGGGGSAYTLIRIKPQEILDAGKAEARDISKE